jgi:cyclic pyranopterin phosphate synthase
VKWFPKCLLGPFAKYHDDGQPPSVIPDDYFVREPSYGCIYEGVCEDAAELAEKATPASGRCAGLSEPYIRRFGWEADLLVPKRRRAEAGFDVGRSLVKDAGPRRTEAAEVAAWLDRFGLATGQSVAGWRLGSAARKAGAEALSLVFTRGGGGSAGVGGSMGVGAGSVVVRVFAREEGRRAALRTRSFDLSYAASGAVAPEAVRELLTAVVGAIAERDSGGLSLPAGPPRDDLEDRLNHGGTKNTEASRR